MSERPAPARSRTHCLSEIGLTRAVVQLFRCISFLRARHLRVNIRAGLTSAGTGDRTISRLLETR